MSIAPVSADAWAADRTGGGARHGCLVLPAELLPAQVVACNFPAARIINPLSFLPAQVPALRSGPPSSAQPMSVVIATELLAKMFEATAGPDRLAYAPPDSRSRC